MASPTITPLLKRADFLRLNGGGRFAAPGLVLQMMRTPDEVKAREGLRLGITVTKKIGNAVVRNRYRRRLREAAREVLTVAGRPGHDYVLIARVGGIERPFADLKQDLARALSKVHGKSNGQSNGQAH